MLSLAGMLAWLLAAGMAPLGAQNGGGTLTGTVLGQAGKPIDGAAVTVKDAGGAASGSAVTDAQGRFSVSGLAAGTYSVVATSPDLR